MCLPVPVPYPPRKKTSSGKHKAAKASRVAGVRPVVLSYNYEQASTASLPPHLLFDKYDHTATCWKEARKAGEMWHEKLSQQHDELNGAVDGVNKLITKWEQHLDAVNKKIAAEEEKKKAKERAERNEQNQKAIASMIDEQFSKAFAAKGAADEEARQRARELAEAEERGRATEEKKHRGRNQNSQRQWRRNGRKPQPFPHDSRTRPDDTSFERDHHHGHTCRTVVHGYHDEAPRHHTTTGRRGSTRAADKFAPPSSSSSPPPPLLSPPSQHFNPIFVVNEVSGAPAR